MKIEGIENISNVGLAKVIVEFVLDYYEDKDIEIEEVDSNMFSINGDNYALYTEQEQDDLIDDFNTELFQDAVCTIPKDWRIYVNKSKWIDDNGISDFEDYWDQTNFDFGLEYVTRIDGVNIYKNQRNNYVERG